MTLFKQFINLFTKNTVIMQEKEPKESDCPICGQDINELPEACSECGINPFN